MLKQAIHNNIQEHRNVRSVKNRVRDCFEPVREKIMDVTVKSLKHISMTLESS